MLILTREKHLHKFNLISGFGETVTFKYKDNLLVIQSGSDTEFIVVKEDVILEKDFTFTVSKETFDHIHRILKSTDVTLTPTDKGVMLSAKNFSNEYGLVKVEHTQTPAFVGFNSLFEVNRGELEEALSTTSHALKDSIKHNKIFTGFTFLVSPEYTHLFTLHVRELVRFTFSTMKINKEFVTEEFKFCVPQTLIGIVKNIQDEYIKVSYKTKKILVELNSGITIALSLLVGEFPKFEQISEQMDSSKSLDELVKFNTKEFKEAIESLGFFTDKTRLYAITLTFDGDSVILTSSSNKGNSKVTVKLLSGNSDKTIVVSGNTMKNFLNDIRHPEFSIKVEPEKRRIYYTESNPKVIFSTLKAL